MRGGALRGCLLDAVVVALRDRVGAVMDPHMLRRERRQVPAKGGQEQSMNLDWGYSGSYSPDGKSLVYNRHPAVWSRQHYRGSYAADLWIADLAGGRYTPILSDERYNRFWPMWGADDAIYFVGDPLPNDKSVKPGSAEVRRSVNNIYKIPAKGGTPTQVTRHTGG